MKKEKELVKAYNDYLQREELIESEEELYNGIPQNGILYIAYTEYEFKDKQHFHSIETRADLNKMVYLNYVDEELTSEEKIESVETLINDFEYASFDDFIRTALNNAEERFGDII